MQTIEATFNIITPMFIGGGNNDVELRPPSIKGALRFWWRAMQWGACLQATKNDNKEALKLLHKQEAALFGAATKKDSDYGQSLFFIKLTMPKNNTTQNTWPKNNDAGAGYLGYGLDKTKDNPHRTSINPTKFKLCLVLKPTITQEQIYQLKNTLKLWGLLGGLGSRARRGFGSVSLIKIDNESLNFSNQQAYIKTINDLLKTMTLAPQLPRFTALNALMQIVILNNKETYSDYKSLMNEVGNQYKQARKSVDGLNRAVFGLPLEGLRGKSDTKNRRSSPLFLHIHKLNTAYIAVFSFIPADFHHEYNKGKTIGFYHAIERYMQTMTKVYP